MDERKRPADPNDGTAEERRAAADDVGRAAAALNAKGWPHVYDHTHAHAAPEGGTHEHRHRHQAGGDHHPRDEHGRA
jgi:hypothetical protein